MTTERLLDEANTMLDAAMAQMDDHAHEYPIVPITLVCHTLQGHYMGLVLPSSENVAETIGDAIHHMTLHDGVQPLAWLLLMDTMLRHVNEVSGAEGDACEALLVAIVSADSDNDCMVTNRYQRMHGSLLWHEREFNYGPSTGVLPDVLRASFAYRN